MLDDVTAEEFVGKFSVLFDNDSGKSLLKAGEVSEDSVAVLEFFPDGTVSKESVAFRIVTDVVSEDEVALLLETDADGAEKVDLTIGKVVGEEPGKASGFKSGGAVAGDSVIFLFTTVVVFKSSLQLSISITSIFEDALTMFPL